MFAAFMVAYWFFYLYPNMFASWPVHYLPLLALDKAIPFLPWTFLIYTSDYTLFLVAIILHQSKEGFNSMSRMCFATLAICGAFFVLYPTTYPRPEYPQGPSWVIRGLMQMITLADSPKNCFPSMHVALTSVATWSLRNHSPKVVRTFIVWTFLIFVSTLTTKQHYFVDILGGMGVASFVIFAEKYVFSLVRARLPSGFFPR